MSLLKHFRVLILFSLISSCVVITQQEETFKSILTENELLELDDPAIFTKYVVKTSGAVVATGLSAACIFFFLTPPGVVACSGAAILGVSTAIVAPDYVAPDARISKCSPEEYGARLKWLKDRKPQNEDCSKLLKSVDKYCAQQCIYPTMVSPVGGDRCYGGQVKRSVIIKYEQILVELSCDYGKYQTYYDIYED